jgi:large subunit ribosomal protein L25
VYHFDSNHCALVNYFAIFFGLKLTLFVVTPLKIGSKLYVGDIKTNNFSFMHPDNAVVVAVKMSRTAMKGGAAGADDDDEETPAAEGEAPAAEETSAE